MKILERKDIDTARWNARIAADPIENVFSYAWYLDSVSENWSALISDADYSTVLPIPYTTKLGIKRFYQAPFTREYHIFGTDFDWKSAITLLSQSYKHLAFRTQLDNLGYPLIKRVHQELILDSDYTANYNSNAKRQVKKGRKAVTFKQIDNADTLVALFNTTVGHKIDSIDDNDLATLTRLMNQALALNHGELIAAFNEDNTMEAAGFFLKDKGRITYLKGAATDEGKKNGVMYALMDFAFEKYSPTYRIFDFGGSHIENVATFFKRLGGEDRHYFDYTIDNTPFWFKTLKKIKG